MKWKGKFIPQYQRFFHAIEVIYSSYRNTKKENVAYGKKRRDSIKFRDIYVRRLTLLTKDVFLFLSTFPSFFCCPGSSMLCAFHLASSIIYIVCRSAKMDQSQETSNFFMCLCQLTDPPPAGFFLPWPVAVKKILFAQSGSINKQEKASRFTLTF